MMAPVGFAVPSAIRPVGVQRIMPYTPVHAKEVSPPVRVLLSAVNLRGVNAPGDVSR
jgi:hypothetical protein